MKVKTRFFFFLLEGQDKIVEIVRFNSFFIKHLKYKSSLIWFGFWKHMFN